MRRLLPLAVLPLVALFVVASSAGTPRSDTPDRLMATVATALPDWPVYHGSLNRHGVSTTMPTAVGAPKLVKHTALDGQVYASPIVARGVVVIATENNSLYGFTPAGTLLWHRKLGAPALRSELPCGNITPVSGITGTPAYSASSHLFYVVVEHGSPVRHAVAAVNPLNGAVAWTRQLELTGTSQDAMQQRGALNIGNGRVWITFGGRAGDCGNYKGRLIGLTYDGAGSAVVYTVPTTREAGMWTPPGPTIDSSPNRRIYTAVGNGESVVGDPYDHSDSVLEFNADAHLISSFSPTNWAAENAGDVDLGSQGPALVNQYVFQAGKSGTAYTLNRDALGGIGGQVSSLNIPCHSYGGTAVNGDVVYAPCTEGVRAIRINANGTMTPLWVAAGDVEGSPVVGGGRVWALSQATGTLQSLNPANGQSLGSVSVGAPVSRFATPAIYGSRMYVGTMQGFAIVTTS